MILFLIVISAYLHHRPQGQAGSGNKSLHEAKRCGIMKRKFQNFFFFFFRGGKCVLIIEVQFWKRSCSLTSEQLNLNAGNFFLLLIPAAIKG